MALNWFRSLGSSPSRGFAIFSANSGFDPFPPEQNQQRLGHPLQIWRIVPLNHC
jgi:hypothetical protein